MKPFLDTPTEIFEVIAVFEAFVESDGRDAVQTDGESESHRFICAVHDKTNRKMIIDTLIIHIYNTFSILKLFPILKICRRGLPKV
jgi:hypothetical protein